MPYQTIFLVKAHCAFLDMSSAILGLILDFDWTQVSLPIWGSYRQLSSDGHTIGRTAGDKLLQDTQMSQIPMPHISEQVNGKTARLDSILGYQVAWFVSLNQYLVRVFNNQNAYFQHLQP